jgi:hypothetical protein
MLNIPVSIFAHPLYHLVQGTVTKWEQVALLFGVVVLWSYIGWSVDVRNAAPRPRTTLRIFSAIVGCAFAVFVLIEAVTIFHAGILYRFIAVSWSVLMFRHFILFLRTSPAVPETERIAARRCLPRITLVSVVVSWAIFLVIGAVSLPPLDSAGTPNGALAHLFAVCGALLLFVTIYAVLLYLTTAWRKLSTAPNRSYYVVWVGFETGLAVAAAAAVVYTVMRR